MRIKLDGQLGRTLRVAGLVCLAMNLWAGLLRAAPLPAEPAAMSIAIYTYHLDRGNLVPSKVFSGVLLSPSHVITSTYALMHGHEQLANDGGVPAEVYGVVNAGGQQKILALTPTAMNVKSPVGLLEVAEQDRQITAGIIRKSPTAKPLDDAVQQATVVGVIGPYGAYREGLEKLRVPRPVALTVTLGKRLSIADGKVKSAEVTHTLPTQMAGAGVWDAQDRLIGMLVRVDGVWQVVDPVTSAKLMASTPDGEGPAMTDVTLPGTTTPTPPKPEPKLQPEPEPEPVQPTEPKVDPDKPKTAPGIRKELRGLFEMMAQQGLKPAVDPSLLDYVQQEQADLAMSYIAAGQHAKALELVRDIEPLASGKLAEQLNYRAVLGLLLTGQFDKDQGRVDAAARAADPLVQIRGKLLQEVMQDNPRGTFHGQSLSQADVLGRACKAVLAKRRHTMDITFDSIRAYQLTNNYDFDRLMQRLDTLAAEVTRNQKAWPGYFDTLEQSIVAMREQSTLDEYGRTRRAISSQYTAYQLAKQQTEEKSGAGWAKPGYWPSEKVAEVNDHAERFNTLLKHYARLDKLVPPSTRMPLSEQHQNPLQQLPQARPQ